MGGGYVVSFTNQPRFTPRKTFWYPFCYWLNKPQGKVRLEGIGKLKKIQ
jgi:hypothetical protein